MIIDFCTQYRDQISVIRHRPKLSVRARLEFTADTLLYTLAVLLLTRTQWVHTGSVLLSIAILRMQYIAHDIWHGQYTNTLLDKGCNAIEVLTGTSRRFWCDKEHNPHHAFTNTFVGNPTQVDPDNFIGMSLPVVIMYGLWAQHVITITSIYHVMHTRSFLSLGRLCLFSICFHHYVQCITYGVGYFLMFVVTQVVHHRLDVDIIEGVQIDSMTRAVQTSNTIDCGPLVSWWMGGHDHQLAHHMFPNLPRHRLPEIQPYILEYCRQHNIVHTPVAFSDAFLEFVRVYCSRVNGE
jgi:fatty acid desaturase